MIDEGLFGNVVSLKGGNMEYTSLEEVFGDPKFGKQKLVDTGGRVDRFNKRYAKKG